MVLSLKKEVKRLIRCGIPNHLRAKVWGMLINEKVKDIKDDKGRPYYIELCNALSESEVGIWPSR